MRALPAELLPAPGLAVTSWRWCHGRVTDRDAARAAKTTVRQLVAGHPSVNGVGLRRDAVSGWVVKVNLRCEDDGLCRALPPEVDGVRVDVVVVGPVRASTALPEA